jgi:hypothetical protein
VTWQAPPSGTTTPIAGACIHVWNGSKVVAATKTGPDGYYRVAVPAGTYTVEFTDNARCGGGNFYTIWYFRQKSQAAANPVVVQNGAVRTGVGDVMQPSGS